MVFIALLLLVEAGALSSSLTKCFATQPIDSTADDDDVTKEAERLRAGDYDAAEEPIVINGLAKRCVRGLDHL